MTHLPNIFGGGRRFGVAVVAALAVGQAAAAGVVAFATRDVFAAFSAEDAVVPVVALAVIIAAGAAIAALRVVERALGEGIGQSYAAALRKTLFAHLSRMPAHDVACRRAGSLAIRFVGDLTAVRSWVSMGVARIISAAIVLPGALIALFLLNPVLAAAAAGPLAVAVAVMAKLAPKLGPLHRRLRSRRARLAADLAERVPVAPELRLLGRQGQEVAQLERGSRSLKDAAVARMKASATLQAVPQIASSVSTGALLTTAFLTGASAAEAAGALATMAILSLPLRDLATIWDKRRAWEIARDKCNAILEAPTLARSPAVPSAAPEGPARVQLTEVTGRALRGLTATAEPGTRIAVIGGNGAGKSTLLSLVAGLEHAESGLVAIDGEDIRSLSPKMRASAITYVGPRSPILRGSLRRALTLGINPRPDDETIIAAVWAYGLADVMERIGGLDGKLSEGGRNLSSGEARRVHLVRAALARPSLLLLDEPDDALDRQGRQCLDRLLSKVDATTIIITHDPALARRADLLWFIADGALAGSGAPQDLIRTDQRVAHFFRPQQVA